MRFRSSWLRLATFAAGAVLAVAPGSDLGAQGQGQGLAVGRPEWTAAVRHDTSRPLRDMPSQPMVSTRPDFEVMRPPVTEQGANDPVVQSFAVAPLAATPGNNFDGIGEGVFGFNVNYAPPDTVGEAGANHYVQWVNVAFAVFDKATGAIAPGFPKAGNTLWSGFAGDCSTRNDGDPIVQYDQLADRWILTQFSVAAGNYLQCVAVSTSPDPTGSYYRYAFQYNDFPDYPKLSVWPDAYYITFNMFRNGTQFTGGRVCAYDRARMLDGLSAAQQCVQTGYASLLPADLEGKTLPPAGAPNYVVNRSGTSALNLWKFHVDWATPANSTFTGPTSIPVSGFSIACNGGACIPQKDTTNRLDSLGDRLMYRLSYRNLGGNHEALVVNHSVTAGTTTGIRWYEIDVQGGSPQVHQEGTYAPADGLYRWMGSMAMDKLGNIAVGYSTSSSLTNPAIKFAGREATSGQAPGVLSAETGIWEGAGAQTGGLQRWGDYSTLSVDPVDDCTFWFTTEYLKGSGTFNWNTRIGSFKFTSCSTSTSPDFMVTAAPSSSAVTRGESADFTVTVSPTNGYNGNGTYSTGPLPEGVMPAWESDNTFGGTSSSSRTLTLATSGSTPAGTHNITITATDGTLTHSTTVTLVVNAPVVPDFTITASPGSRTVKRGRSTTYTITVTPTGGFSGSVTLSLTNPPPAGVTLSLLTNPVIVSGATAGTSTLSVVTAANATRGTYTLTITGTGSSGALAHSTSVTLKVQ